MGSRYTLPHMANLIIGFVGKPGCGKGTAADVLRKQYGAGYCRFSAILNDILSRLYVEKVRENFAKLSEGLRKSFGEDVLSYAIEQETLRAPEEIVVVDGIRRVEDIIALEPLPQFKLIAIEASPEIRYERIKHRGERENETNMTWEQFLAEEQLSTEVTIPAVMARARETVNNDGSPAELEKRIHELMEGWGYTSIA